MPKCWSAGYTSGDKFIVREFDKLTETLAWIDDSEAELGYYDPEWSASVTIEYELHEEYEYDPDHLMALLDNRLPAKVIDGYAGGMDNHRVEIGEHRFWVTRDTTIFDDRDL